MMLLPPIKQVIIYSTIDGKSEHVIYLKESPNCMNFNLWCFRLRFCVQKCYHHIKILLF